jgi:poly-gamma-glutamate capsule biosynthesis protein CapA/YwtB (metallophosphatase superfamily)
MDAAPLELAMTGDAMLGRLVNEAIAERGFDYPWGDMLPLLRAPDLLLVSLECALTAHTKKSRGDPGKSFHFRADLSAVEVLKTAGVDFVSLANNHAASFGNIGLLETVEVLDRAGIAHSGAGKDLHSARTPAILEARGRRVGILACADYLEEWAAGPRRTGIYWLPVPPAPAHFQELAKALHALREQTDLVVICIHWGPNMRERPTAAFRDLARQVIEAGADIFWGHSAHVVQGVEVWDGKPILYDTGDFVDDYMVDPLLRNDLSALFLLSAYTHSVEAVELLPVQIGDMQVNPARDPERAWFARHFTRLSGEMGSAVHNDGEKLSVDAALAGQRKTASGP